MIFEEYLITKKIDATEFQKSEPQRFDEWKYLFAQMHAESFTAQKKFLINSTRRKYQIMK
ncbi:MAG: hypothetical protein ACK4YV_00155 [Emticicia sp.]